MMKTLILCAAITMLALPAQACEGFKNSLSALEHAMGIEQSEKLQLPQTKAPSKATEKHALILKQTSISVSESRDSPSVNR